MKRYLFVMRHLPHHSSHVQETLDQLLTAAAFDQRVSLLFADDGVLQLKNGQGDAAPFKQTSAMFQALEIYGVEALYAEAESLAERGLQAADLLLPVQVVQRRAVAELLRGFQVVLPD